MTTKDFHQITIPTPYDVGDVHIYVHISEHVTMFDAGVNTDEAWDVLVDELKKINLKPTDIKRVVLTHHHPDHTGLLDRLNGVEEVYGHEIVHYWLTKDENYLNHYLQFFNELYDQWRVPSKYRHIDRTVKGALKYGATGELTKFLKEGDRIPGLSSFLVIETPGHAESHLSFLDEKTGVLIGGDFLLKHISSNPLLEPPIKRGDERPKPLLKYRQSMKHILNFPVTTILPGHGEIFSNHKALIKERLEKQEQRAKKVLNWLQEKPLSPMEICKLLFPRHYETQFGLTMSETIGQLDYLQSIGEVEIVFHDEELVFQKKHSLSL